VRFITFNLSRSRSAYRPIAFGGPASAGPLLVIAILLPQFLAQLRISFVLSRLAQLPRDDVVITTVRDIRGRRVGPAAAAGTATYSAATTALTAALALALTFALTLALALSLTLTLTLALALALLTSTLAVAAVTVAFAAGAAILSIGAGTFALSTAPRATSSAALASNRGLLVAHATIKYTKSLIELAVDLRGAFASRHRAATATTAALRTVRSATCRAAAVRGTASRAALATTG
jgi:hypothetical protein